MQNLNSEEKPEQIKYINPLVLSHKSPQNKIIHVENNRNYYINSVKNDNNIENSNVVKKNFSNIFQQNKNNVYTNSVSDSNFSNHNNNKSEINSIYYNTDNINKIYTEKNINNIKKKNKYHGEYSIIDNSVNNHIQNFLIRYKNNENIINEKNNSEKKYFRKIKNQNPKNLLDIKKNKMQSNNIFEVMKELKVVNDKKNLNQKMFSDRENNNHNKTAEEPNYDMRVFSENKNESRQRENCCKFINEIKDRKIDENIMKENLYKKFNLKKVNINKIKGDFIYNYNTINGTSDNSNHNLKINYRSPYTLSRINQSLEKRKKFIIKSKDRDYNSVINNNIEFSKINNYNCNTFDNKGRNIIKIENSNNPNYKKINKVQINSINRKNKINPNVNNNYNSIDEINKNKSKINVIEKQDSIHFNGINENIKYYNGFSPSNKSINNDNFRILVNNNKQIINNIGKNIYGSPTLYINNDSSKDIKEKVNFKIRKSSFKSVKLNSNKTRIKTETNETNSKYEMTDFNNNDYNNNNYIGNNLMYDNLYSLSNLHLNLNNKVLNKSLNYNKKGRYTIDTNFFDKEDKYKRITNRKVKRLNMNSNGNIIYNTVENEKSNTSKNQIKNYNYMSNKNIRFIHKINTQNYLKLLKSKEEIKKNKNYKKLIPIFNVPNINQIIKKSKQISEKKFKFDKDLLNNRAKEEIKIDEKENSLKNNGDNNINKDTPSPAPNSNPDCNDSDFMDFNRLDLEFKNNNTICKKLNKYKNPRSTANDIIDMYNKKKMNLESNDTELSNFNETNSSINSLLIKSNTKNKNKPAKNINKDLDLSNISSVFNSRFQYINEKKSNKKKIVNNKINKGSDNNFDNYFSINNSNKDLDEEKKINSKSKSKSKSKKKIKKKKSTSKKKKTKIDENNNNNYNTISTDKIKKEKKIKKRKTSVKSKKGDDLNENINENNSKKMRNISDINNINEFNWVKNEKKNNDLVFINNNDESKTKRNTINIPENMLFYSNISLENNIYNKNKISINKKRLNNNSVIPNLYINLYKSRNHLENNQNSNPNVNLNPNAIYNIFPNANDKIYKLSRSDNNRYNQNGIDYNWHDYNYINNNYNNYISSYPKINNHMGFKSFTQKNDDNSFLHFSNDFNFINNSSNYLINQKKNNKSFNLNYLNKNKIIKNNMEDGDNDNKKDKNGGNNAAEEDGTQEEIEESEEENDEEDEVQSQSREDKSNTTLYLNKNINKEKYLLELKENGLPDLPKNKILSCNIGSLINISIYNGLPISSNISLITDSFKLFPSSDFVENLIKDNSSYDTKKNTNNEYFENKVNSYQKYPSIINTKVFFQVICERAGNITFMFMYKDERDHDRIKFTEPFYILVNPLIDLSNNNNSSNKNVNDNNVIELTQIKMQTVISKNIGTLKNNFESYFEEASLLGYNFIHFKTLQSLSSSENLYSIKDHNELNNSFFIEKNKNKNIALNKEKKNDIFQNTIKKLKQKYNIGGITDVILTQASTESEWILTHPECAYNLENSPWLNVAYKLDEILVNYSNKFFNKKVSCSSAPYINNEKDLEETMDELGNEVYKNNLEEYFLIPIQDYLDKFSIYYKNYLLNQDKEDYIIKRNLLLNEIKKDYSLRESNYNKNSNSNSINDNNSALMNESIIYEIISQSCINYGYKRYGVEMPVELISLLIIEKYRIKSKRNELINDFQFLKEVKNYINLINKEWLDKSKEMLRISLLNVKEFIRYQFIQLNRIGIKRLLVDSYFYVIDKNDPKKILLCNGWIMQSEDSSNIYPDITAYGTWYYFKRKVIIWKDTIKINYGENLSKTPEYLLNYMTKYITYLSNIFDGLYIESLANIPLFILKYFTYKAREVNSNIIFMTQLPTVDDDTEGEDNDIVNYDSQKDLEKKFSEEIGINLFVHEIIWDCTNIEIIKNILSNVNSHSNMTEGKLISKFNSNLYSMSKTSGNRIFFGCYKYLKYHKPFCILYDLTQDNQSYYEKYNILAIQNAMMSAIGILDCAIGSTRGFDQLFPYQVSSQKEQRLYFFDNKKIKNEIKKVINIKENEQNEQYQEIIFELHTSNINLNEDNYSNKNIYIDINNIKSVKLALSFHKWKPDITLEKINKNLFMTKIKLPLGKHYYKYVLDEHYWICDASKPVEIDEDKNINNILDLNNFNDISLSDITLLRCYLNSLREKFDNKKSEIFLQKNNDLLCVIRMITESKSLINNNIDDNVVEEYKNKLKYNYKSKDDEIHNNNNIKYNNTNNNDYNSYNYNSLVNEELNSYEGYAIITRPTYNIIDENSGRGDIIIPGKIDSVICSFSSNKEEDFNMNNILDKDNLLGVNGNIVFRKDINYLSRISTINYYNTKSIIHFHSFPPNSILILKFVLEDRIINSIENLNRSIEILFNKGDKFVKNYNLCDINKILYKSEEEEREWTFKKRGTYELNIIEDDSGEKNEIKEKKDKIKFIYSGLHQIMDIIKKIKRKEKQNILFNDDINNNNGNIISLIDEKKFIQSLYYDIAENDHLIEYIFDRINNINSFSLIRDYINNNILEDYKQLPSHIKPIFFESIIISLYQNIIRISLLNIPYYILNFGDFSTALSLCRYEFFGNLSSSFTIDISKKQNSEKNNISISKGIPYNTIGGKRMYFRDTLIAFKSLFLITNSFNEGKNLLKIIGSSLRHGLIPDMFDEGQKPRYNSRDTCWYFINAVKNYINYSKDYNFLKEDIELIFTSDNNFNEHLQKKIKGEMKLISLENIIHIIFQSHAKGIHFREWDYSTKNYFGTNSYLKKEGYNIDIELDPNTGFIYGGNYCNNGTWMNKLGNSIKGKNKGTPATPRPGANIEIISLVYSCLDFVVDMANRNYYKYKSVVLSNGINYPYTQWKLLIKDSFEDEFFVSKSNLNISSNYNNNDWNNNQIKGDIFKDYKNKNNVNIYEFQLRPNFLIALYISPELFSYKNIIKALNNVELYLLREDSNVIGLKTLDKTDKEYNGLYEYKESNNYFTSCGFNIHNGIEHSWLYGLYLILKIKYFYNEKNNNSKITPDGNEDESQKLIKFASSKLIPIMNIIKNNKWFGIPEMTDELGHIIKDGNQSDIKAMAIFFELIELLSKLDLEYDDVDYSNDNIDSSNVEI